MCNSPKCESFLIKITFEVQNTGYRPCSTPLQDEMRFKVNNHNNMSKNQTQLNDLRKPFGFDVLNLFLELMIRWRDQYQDTTILV